MDSRTASPALNTHSYHTFFYRLIAALLLIGLLGGCAEQKTSQINPSAYNEQAPATPQTQAEAQAQAEEIGAALGIEQAQPARDDSGELYLQVQTPSLLYSDSGLIVSLAGEVTLAQGAQLGQALWQQTAGPQVQLLNPSQLQAQAILPNVTTVTDLEFALAAADTNGRVAQASSRIRIQPLTAEQSSPLAQMTAQQSSATAEQIVVTLALPQPPQAPITLNYTTQNGTALAGRNYKATQGQVVLNANTPQALIPIDVLNSAETQGDTYFRVTYSTANGAASQHVYVVLPALSTEPAEPVEPTTPVEPTEPSEPLSYNLNYTATNGGRIEGTAQQTLQPGNSGTAVTAIAEPGFIFTGWSDGQTNAQRTDTPTANLSLNARFRIASPWLISGHNGNLSVNAGPTTATVTWPIEKGVTYNLIVTKDPLTELDNYSAYDAELLTDITPPGAINRIKY